MTQFEDVLPGLLIREGGLVDDPDDPGGLTNFGISLRAHPELGRAGILALTPELAGAIYLREYWRPLSLGTLAAEDQAIAILDFAVHSGKKRATIEAQRVCAAEVPELVDDGDLGPKTLAALDRFADFDFASVYHWRRVRYWNELTKRRPLRKFLRGWIVRLVHVDDEIRRRRVDVFGNDATERVNR